ncbi:ABC transporter permease [Clostridium sp. AF19-22AC]|uniref:Transport permease protein n=1 Tax=Faecalicatena orotica TaxID=1544 RepID=A0A2Y9B904_9FIRM|nr:MULTISPECIES: ABC transporter permease [Clostridia]PWJ32061.1 ABC-2 type transport system permease protein [Faecalicatena orotica]RHR31904.1 ABC transporter permease [Clostridium sp. AF19-22AC]SSA53892.1 ABC-2 type transport system permease protein [Faecalicatena orotica]
MSGYIKNFLKFQPLLSELVARDIKIKYRRSVLGVLWTLLNPLCMMIILSIVFSNIFKFDVENFPLYVLSGQVIFNFFNDSTTSSMSSIISSASLIKKVYVPKYLFVLSRVVSSFINLLASFTALLLVMVATRAELHYTAFLSVIPLMMVVGFSLGVGLILAALTVKFRDIIHLYSVFTTGLMYLTPVIYPMSILPEKIKIIVMINPLTNYLIMFRDLMMGNTLPSLSSFLIGLAEVAAALLLGVYVFYKNQDEFILNL